MYVWVISAGIEVAFRYYSTASTSSLYFLAILKITTTVYIIMHYHLNQTKMSLSLL